MKPSTSKFINEYATLFPNIFDGITNLGDLIKKLKKLKDKEYYNEYVGFCWEYVVAEYFKKFGDHDMVNVCEYRQTYAGSKGDDADYGVDGWGWDINGKKRIACQVKFRANSQDNIAWDFEGKASLETFIREIIRSISQEDGRTHTTILLATTTNEGIRQGMKSEMEKCQFSRFIANELKQLNLDMSKLEFRVYNIDYWNNRLNNVRFWDHLRVRFSQATS